MDAAFGDMWRPYKSDEDILILESAYPGDVVVEEYILGYDNKPSLRIIQRRRVGSGAYIRVHEAHRPTHRWSEECA